MPHGGVLSTTMSCLVVDKLLRMLSEAGFFTRAYVDCTMIIIIANDQGIAVDLMRSRLSIAKMVWISQSTEHD